MKILHLLNTGKFSGAENVACQIIDLMKPDVESVYCSLDGDIRVVLEKRNVMFEPISCMSMRNVKHVINKIKPDVIHAHDMRASFYAALACGTIPLVCHVHNNAYDSRKINLKSLLFFYAALKAKHIFWVSDTSFSGYYFHSFLSSKSSVLLNVINVEKVYERMKSDVNSYSYDITFVGRLTYQKNPERLIGILKKLLEILPSFKAAIIGDGPLKGETEKLVKENKLENNVSLLGFQENPYKILKDSKVMLLVSRWEGLPMCVLEALALGVPVVSTPTDGISSVIKNENNGYICEGDEEIVLNLKRILSNNVLYGQMHDNCIENSLKYNDNKLYKNRILEVYKTVSVNEEKER